MINPDEEIPVRSQFDLTELKQDLKFTIDEDEQSTLKRVYLLFGDSIKDLDSWHAFDLTETELKLKQQIKAHQIAADIVMPLYEVMGQALATIDQRYKERNNIK